MCHTLEPPPRPRFPYSEAFKWQWISPLPHHCSEYTWITESLLLVVAGAEKQSAYDDIYHSYSFGQVFSTPCVFNLKKKKRFNVYFPFLSSIHVLGLGKCRHEDGGFQQLPVPPVQCLSWLAPLCSWAQRMLSVLEVFPFKHSDYFVVTSCFPPCV